MEKKAKFTPGPWGISSARSINSYRLTTKNAQGQYVLRAYVNFAGNPSEEDQANALLIAAAPELLEALINFVRSVKAHSDWKDHYSLVVPDALAAIKKAKGE